MIHQICETIPISNIHAMLLKKQILSFLDKHTVLLLLLLLLLLLGLSKTGGTEG